jgi:3-hydroxybutyryl-CoA dehydratase
MTRLLPPGPHAYADLRAGDRIETGAATITGAMIDAFADLSGDRFELHMSKSAAEALGFPDRVAHGLLVLSVVDGLKNGAGPVLPAVASLGWDWTFSAPVLIGDTVRATVTIAEKRSTRRPDRGILRLAFDVANQRGETVQKGSNLMMCRA